MCNDNCGACCIAPSISSPLPNMPHGKKGGERCVNLDANLRCKVYEERPPVCRNFKFDKEYCGANHHEALQSLSTLERLTSHTY